MLSSSSIAGQGSAPRNNFLPADDVALGTEAAATVRANVALVKDEEINAFFAGIGRRLVDSIPDPARQPAFSYSFEILDHLSVAVYGLPGGPVFATRGFLQNAASEQSVAEAIAGAIGHIALRHGTAQADAGDAFGRGAITGADIGAVIAGPQPSVLGQGTSFGVASYFFFYKREFEMQAARLASQLLAGARDERPPDWFHAIQARLRGLPPASPISSATVGVGTGGRVGVAIPSGAWRAVTAGDSLLLSVPSNWTRVSAGNSIAFAPDGALLTTPGGALTMTHGLQVGVARSPTGDLQRDTQMLLETLSRASSNVRWTPSYQATTLARRAALTTSLLNVSAITGTFEQVLVCLAHLPGDSLLYLIGVSPLDESSTYRLAFDRVRESFQPVR